MTQSATELVDLVRRLFELVAAGDISGYLAHMHPDVEARPLTGRRLYRGRDDIRRFLAEAPPGGFAVSGLEMRAHGDTVVASGTLLAPSSLGGSIALPAAWTIQVRNGCVVRMRAFHHVDQAVADAAQLT